VSDTSRGAATIQPVPSGKPLNILFVMEHPGVGSLMPALRLLHGREHHLKLGYEALKSVESHRELQDLADDCPGIEFIQLPAMGNSGWVALAAWLRRSIDYLRYLEPRYPARTRLRTRAARKAPPATRTLARAAKLFGATGIAGLKGAFQSLEACLAPPGHIQSFLADESPDVLLLAHLLPIGTTHADYLRAARRLGIRTVFPVRGWDNLTNKGLLRDAPDAVLVWNDLQAKEARELHRIPEQNLRLTGAPLCDPWFEREPSRTREEFCRDVGLRADRPIVLYVCSSGFVARNEVDFVRSWIQLLRARGAPFAEAGFLVRPHPLNAAQWADVDLGEGARVWPRFGEAPHDEASRDNYFDTLYHSDAVVGINSTAQIESAIVGRPVHTILADEFKETQQGTLHFHYLKADEFGLLHVARTIDEHAEQLEASLRGEGDDGRNERFLKRFVRPLGLDRSASGLVADAIEDLGRSPAPAPDRGPPLAPVVRAGLAPFAWLAGRSAARRLETRAAKQTPTQELMRLVRKRALHRTGAPVVAGPWTGDEIGELLYWIPFLRRLQGLDTGLKERLFVIRRSAGGVWYDSIGAGQVDLERLIPDEPPDEVTEDELQGPLRDEIARTFGLGSRAFRVLPAGLVAATREALAGQKPSERKRLLEFAPITAQTDIELPDRFVAVGQAELAAELRGRVPVVDLEPLGRAAQTGVLARSAGYVGPYGPEAIVAVLAGVDAVVFSSEVEPADDHDLKLVSSFLAGTPFGRLQLATPEQMAERAAGLLETQGALAAV
jgi:hypothetical protein